MFTFETNIDEFERGLMDWQRRQIPFALAVALNRMRKDVIDADRDHKERVFDRPRPFTLNSTTASPATKQKLFVEFRVREFAAKGTPAYKYLYAQIMGGYRRQKRSEKALVARGFMDNTNGYWVPGPGVKRDAYGNVSGPTIVRILADLQASTDGSQNRTAQSTKRNRNYRKERYFVPPKGSKLAPGVWVRRGKSIQPALLFVSAPKYDKRYEFFENGMKVARRRLMVHFAATFNMAIRTARR